MKKLIFALLLLLALPIGVNADDIWGKKPTTHRIAYFDYTIPTGYVEIPGENDCYCTKKFPTDRGYFIDLFVSDYTSVSDEFLNLYYMMIANDYPNRYNFEEITIEDHPAGLFQYPSSAGDFTAILYHRDGFTLCLSVASEYASLTAQKEFALALSEKVHYVSSVEAEKSAQIGTVKKSVNLRAEPNADSKKVGALDSGEQVEVLTPYASGNWHKILYDGIICYVSANYIELE